MRTDELTAVILTKNEEDNIERVLSSVLWLNKIILLDSNSTDRTTDLCNRFSNVEILYREFDNHATQWNYAIDCADTPWVLTLDADYVLDCDWPQKWQECEGSFEGYFVKFRYMVNGSAIRGSLYPPKVILFRKNCGRFIQDGHTQRLIINGKLGVFPAKISHDDRKKIARWFINQVRYAELEAEKILSNQKSSITDRIRDKCLLMPFLVVPYCLFICGLIFDGRRGWFYTLQRLASEVLISLTILEKKFYEKK